MRITERRLRSIIRKEIIKNYRLNEGLADSLKSIYKKMFPGESQADSTSSKPESACFIFQRELDNKYRHDMQRYGTEANYYMNHHSRMASPITSNIMRNYSRESQFEGHITKEEFLRKLPLNEFETQEVSEVKKALDLVDAYFRENPIPKHYR